MNADINEVQYYRKCRSTSRDSKKNKKGISDMHFMLLLTVTNAGYKNLQKMVGVASINRRSVFIR